MTLRDCLGCSCVKGGSLFAGSAGASHHPWGCVDSDPGERGGWAGGVGVEQSPDTSGQVAFEAAERFEPGLPFGVFASEVGAGLWVVFGSAQRDDVDRAVQLPVTAPVQPVPLRFA